MTISLFPIPAFNDNYIWLIHHQSTQTALVVDPGDAQPVINFLQQEKISLHGILLTHRHHDHVGGVPELLQHYTVPVFGPAHETIAGVTQTVTENEIVSVDTIPLQFKVLDIPGHTIGHIAYYTDKQLFCGDTLFAAGCGRVFEGTMEQMYQSLQKLATLPDHLLVYCAHEYTLSNLRFALTVEPNNPHIQKRFHHTQNLREKNLPTLPSQLSEEKLTNPFLRCTVPEVIAAAEKHANKKLTSATEVFTCLREWKNNF